MAPIGPIVAIVLQENDVCFTDDNVVRRGVVVQLLMPILHHGLHHCDVFALLTRVLVHVQEFSRCLCMCKQC